MVALLGYSALVVFGGDFVIQTSFGFGKASKFFIAASGENQGC